MKSQKTIANLVLVASLMMSAVGLVQAQRRTTTTYTYTPAPRPEPQPQWHPAPQPDYTPRNVPENHPYNSVPENHPYNIPDNHFNNAQPVIRPSLGANHPNTTVLRPANVTPVIRRAMTYNTRPGGVHIRPDYFAGHFGVSHGFHFNGWGPNCPTCGFTLFNSEWYFNWNGGEFGVMGQIPGNWALGSDYLYIDTGDDGNYYLYDSQFPDFAVQLTFVNNIGDDQAGADQSDDGQ